LRRHRRATGSVEPKPHGGGAVAKITKEQLAIVEALVTAQPDALWDESCERVAVWLIHLKTAVSVPKMTWDSGCVFCWLAVFLR
jgi:hypothetical protein